LTIRSSGYEDYHFDSDDPLPKTPGVYNITVIADTDSDVDEENENNNMFDPPLVFEIVGSPQDSGSVVTSNIDAALIIDFSGSMNSNDPSNNRLEAARYFIDRADDNDFISIIDFKGKAYVSPEKGTLRIVKTNREDLKDAVAINGSSTFGTSLSAGLQLAHTQLSASTTNNQKIAILLTDGKGNYNDEALGYQANGWKIYTIGLSDAADGILLQKIASITGGDYFKVTTDDAARNAITEIYKTINRTVHKSEQTIHQKTLTIHPGEVLEEYFNVPEGTESLWVDRIIPGSDVEMSLVQPDGRVIDRNSQDSDVYHALGATYEIYRVSNPMPGQWRSILKGTDVLPEGEPTNLSVAVTASDGNNASQEKGGAGDTNNCFISTSSRMDNISAMLYLLFSILILSSTILKRKNIG